MNIAWKRGKIFSIYAAIASSVMSIIALVFVVSQSGYASASRLCTALVYAAFWPVLLTGYDMRFVFRTLWIIPVNIAIWATIAFLLGCVIRRPR
jgi:hypothetical protein